LLLVRVLLHSWVRGYFITIPRKMTLSWGVFVLVGGLGGVHRGAESTMDISADLTELGRTNVAVISSGSKAFLDLEKTLEYLETQGVLVSTFGKHGAKVEFPAFYSRGSGLLSPNVVETAKEAAAIIRTFPL